MCLYSGKVKLYGRVFFGLVQSLSDHLGFSTENCAVYMALHKYLALVFLFFLQLFFRLFSVNWTIPMEVWTKRVSRRRKA